MNTRITAFKQAMNMKHFDMAKDLLSDMLSSKDITVDIFNQLNNDLPYGSKASLPKPTFSLTIKPINLIGLKNLPPRQFLLKRINLEKGMLVSLCGSGGSGKTLFAQLFGLTLSNNLDLFGSYAYEPGIHNVLHIDQEQSESLTQRRYERLANGLNITNSNIDRTKLEYKIDDPQFSEKEIEDNLVNMFSNYSLVIIDSLRQVFLCDENNSQIGHHLNVLKRVAERSNSVVMIIHHKGKAGGSVKQTGRGSSAIFDAVDAQIDLDQRGDTIELSCAKNRDGVFWKGISYRVIDSGVFVSEQHATEELKLEIVKEELPIRQEKKQIDIINYLIKDGERNYTGLYEQTGKGNRDLFAQLIGDMIQQKLIKERKGASNSRIMSLGENGLNFLNGDFGVENE